MRETKCDITREAGLAIHGAVAPPRFLPDLLLGFVFGSFNVHVSDDAFKPVQAHLLHLFIPLGQFQIKFSVDFSLLDASLKILLGEISFIFNISLDHP